jgi:hypothetical protein
MSRDEIGMASWCLGDGRPEGWFISLFLGIFWFKIKDKKYENAKFSSFCARSQVGDPILIRWQREGISTYGYNSPFVIKLQWYLDSLMVTIFL